MIKNLKITPEAERDIFAIVSNIQLQDSLASARKTISAIHKYLNTLAELGNIGREGVCEGTKEAIITESPYIAVYKISGDSVVIIRILYRAENFI